SSVSFGGTPAASFTVMSDSVLGATVGSGSSGFVMVANVSGSDSLAGFVFIDSTPSAHALLLKEYPNPAIGVLYVTVPNTTASSKLMLTDMNGKVLRTIYVAPNATTVRVNVSRFVRGMYKVVWTDGKHLANQTVLVLNE
ncbi:MAG TPA: T9SS type A sorting domain-containing protein, partial [Puia sp.]|nr:T9SS type A sorting domain-containing protein [Puia sp.]